MKRFIAQLTFMMTVLFSASFLLLAPVSAQFDPLEKPCEGVTSEVCTENDKGKSGTSPLVGSNGVLITVSNILAIVGGIIAVIIIIVAGIGMILSGGDSGKVSKSRNTIIYAAVGIIVIVISRSIVLFIINRIG